MSGRNAASHAWRAAAVALWLSAALLFCSCAQAEDAPDITARFGVHDGFDRVVIPLPAKAGFSSRQSGSSLNLQLDGIGHLAPPAHSGRRAAEMSGGEGVFSIRLAAGTHAHVFRMGDRLVIDVLDGDAPAASANVDGKAVAPAPAPATGDAATPRVRRLAARKLVPSAISPRAVKAAALPAPPPASAPIPAPPGAPMPQMAGPLPATAPKPDAAAPASVAPPSSAPPNAAASAAAPADAGQVTSASPRAAVTLLTDDPDIHGPAVLVPYGADTGAAAFRRGVDAHVVFDSARPLDLSQLKDDPVFGALTERVLPDGMHLRLKLSPELQLRVARRASGWALAVVHDQAGLKPIATHAENGVLSIAAASPGRVVVVSDETTGGKLLVGTQKTDGQYVPTAHRGAELAMPATWLGVVVEPVSDRISLRPMRDGFSLQAADGPRLALVWSDDTTGADATGKIMTRRFDLPNLPPSELDNRLTLAMRDAALTPKLSRFAARMRVGQAMLAEGLDVEARAVIHAATSDDPAHADDADAAGMTAIATWLVARAGGADASLPDGFDPTTLGTSDEAQFWQALFKSGQPDMSAPAATLAVTWPMLLQYPTDLRRRLVPEVGRILGNGSQDKALSAFLSTFPDPSLDIVRAALLQRQGKTDEALAMLDAVSKRPDRLMRAQALRAAVELRVATKKIDAATAAAALAKQIYAWRGGQSDLDLRLRLAQLRVQAGLWRPALALLRETDTLFPADHPRVQAAETKLVADLLHGDSATKLGALDLVALADEASGLLSAADADTTLAPVLVDKLLALDLPARAQPILQKLFDQANDPSQKAELGIRLSGLLADRGDSKGALSILAESSDDGLAPALVSRRGVLRARLLAATGKTKDALGVLTGMQDEQALELQAGILEQNHDWVAAVKLLETFTGSPAFAAMPEQTQRDLILRLANDESEAGDMAALRRLRDAQAAKFTTGSDAELFAVLTQEPVKATTDLPRAAHELDKLRALPASLSRP